MPGWFDELSSRDAARPVVWRAQVAAWRATAGRARARLARRRHVIVSVLLVTFGLGGALGGGALVGEWCLGLVLMVESAGAVWFGLMRDDGAVLPRRGERTVAEVLEDEARRP